MREIISEMLHRDPSKRPSIKKILEKEFLSDKITSLLSNTVKKHKLTGMLEHRRELPSIEKDHSIASVDKSTLNSRDHYGDRDTRNTKPLERPSSSNQRIPMSPGIDDSKSSIRSSSKRDNDEIHIDKNSIAHPSQDKIMRPNSREVVHKQPIRGKVTLYGDVNRGKSPSKPNDIRKDDYSPSVCRSNNSISP